MAGLTEEDEALIQHFIGLHTEDSQGPAIRVPLGATTNTDWSLCLLSRVISDRTAIESQLQMAMMKAWDADPKTKVSSVAKNTFLFEFADPPDLQRALHGGPWTFKGDLVAFRTVKSHEELHSPDFKRAQLWVQFFNIPLNAFAEEGLLILGSEVGIPVSRPVEGFVEGKRFHKIKVSIDLLKPLKDKVKVTHPFLGEVLSHCVFEKVNRICLFCGYLGHELSSCPDHIRLSTLMQNPENEARFAGHQLLSPTRGPWITNATLIPRAQIAEPRPRLKRPFDQTATQQQPPNSGLSQQGPDSSISSSLVHLNYSGAVSEGETVQAPSSSSQEPPKKPKSVGHVPLIGES